MKTKTFNKTGTVWTVLISALALLLCAALIVGVTGKTKAEYIPAPDSASDDFSGTMLSDYDNVLLYFSSDKVLFDFEDVNLTDYDYVVLDVCDSEFLVNDSYGMSFGPKVDGFDLSTYIDVAPDSTGSLTKSISGLFNRDTGTFTYVFDMRDIENDIVNLHLYFEGAYVSTSTLTEFSSSVLSAFAIEYENSHEAYGSCKVGALYLYGFENAKNCTIGDYIADPTLKLTDCKDSMLYTGE